MHARLAVRGIVAHHAIHAIQIGVRERKTFRQIQFQLRGVEILVVLPPRGNSDKTPVIEHDFLAAQSQR